MGQRTKLRTHHGEAPGDCRASNIPSCGTPAFAVSNIHVIAMVELMARIQTSGTVRHTELSPTGSETSGTDRQSEIVAAINGPITHLLLLKGEKEKVQ